jgi:hypothetical protein
LAGPLLAADGNTGPRERRCLPIDPTHRDILAGAGRHPLYTDSRCLRRAERQQGRRWVRVEHVEVIR